MSRLAPLVLLLACGESDEERPRDGAPANTPPEILGLSFDPAAPTAGESVRCMVDATDADGDALTHAFRWMVDGVEVGTGDTLDAFDAYLDLTCEATTTDGTDDTVAEDSVTSTEACGGLGYQSHWYAPTAADDPSLQLGTSPAELTAEAWVYLKPVDGRSRGLFWKQEDETNASSALVDWGLIVSDEGVLTFATGRTDDGCGYLATEREAAPVDTWFHVAVTYASDGVVGEKTVYVDGIAVASCEGSLKNAANGGRLVVGGATGTAADVPAHGLHEGSMDEVRISSVDRYGGVDFSPSTYHHPDGQTVGLWHFNHDDESVMVDASGLGRDLELPYYAEPEWRPVFFEFGVSCDAQVPDYEAARATETSG